MQATPPSPHSHRHSFALSGSFDPITRGHIALIQRILPRCHKLHIVVASSSDKKTLFSLDERYILVQKSLNDVGLLATSLQVVKWKGLLVDYCQSSGIPSILRGLRNANDLEFERAMATMNHQLDNKIETFFLLADPIYRECSSTAIKELARVCTNPQQLEKFVTKSVIKALLEKRKEIHNAL